MSKEKKPHRFGARISSIFNSADAHHHLEKKPSFSPAKPLSHPQLNTFNPSTANDTPDRVSSPRPSRRPPPSDPDGVASLSSNTPKKSAQTGYISGSSGDDKPHRNEPRSRASGVVTPEPAGKSGFNDGLGDIIGTLEQEIDQMMGSPNLELTSTAHRRPYLAEQPLQIRKSPKDFDISRHQDESSASDRSPLRQLHSSRFPDRDSADPRDSNTMLSQTPRPLSRHIPGVTKSKPPGMSSSHDLLNSLPAETAANHTGFGLDEDSANTSRHNGSSTVRLSPGTAVESDSHEDNDNALSFIDGYNYGSSVSMLDPFSANYSNEASLRGFIGDPTKSSHDPYFYSEKGSIASGQLQSAELQSPEQFQSPEQVSPEQVSPEQFPNQSGQSSQQLPSTEQFPEQLQSTEHFPEQLQSSQLPSAERCQSSSHSRSDTYSSDAEPLFMSPSPARAYVAPESLDAEIESLGQGIQALDQFDSSSSFSQAPFRHGSQKTMVSAQRFSDHYPSSAPKLHKRMSSTSSILSSTSNKHVNLATLKKTFNLRPGEGEHSKYVDTIRRNAGTSYNETGPGKWKLPIGIQPVDKRVMAQLSSSRYNRANVLSSGSRATKSSGVELKHGHLQPRLLAAEVDDFGDNSSKFGDSSSKSNDSASKFGDSSSRFGDSASKFGSKDASCFSNPPKPTQPITPITSKSSTPSGVLAFGSRANSLERAGTLVSVSTTNEASPSEASGRRESSASLESVGSINDNRKVDIYYQHRGYKYDEENLDTDSYPNMNGASESSDDEDGPRLVLANPDSSSD